MSNDLLNNETTSSQMWLAHGFTLNKTSSGNHYLLMEFPESIFMVRDAVSTVMAPVCEGRFKVHARNRALHQMVGEPREVCGVVALKKLIEHWRNEVFRPVVHLHVFSSLEQRPW